MEAALRGVLAVLIVAGSRNLNHFDAALVGYTFATLFAVRPRSDHGQTTVRPQSDHGQTAVGRVAAMTATVNAATLEKIK